MGKQNFKIVCEDCNEIVAHETSDRNHTCPVVAVKHQRHCRAKLGFVCSCLPNKEILEEFI